MKKYIQLITMSVLLGVSTQGMALKSDRDQPANIEADNTEIDFKTGVRTLTNNVLVEQGSLRLKADKLVAKYTKKGDLEKATAWGSLARFKQRQDGQPDDVQGWGKKMVVNYTDNTLTLIGSAALEQGGTTARGDTIVYNMSTEKLRIIGDSNIKTEGKNGKPKRTIKDPFTDAPSTVNTSTVSNLEQTERLQQAQDDTESIITPAPSGRSRLIIQPKILEKNK